MAKLFKASAPNSFYVRVNDVHTKQEDSGSLNRFFSSVSDAVGWRKEVPSHHAAKKDKKAKKQDKKKRESAVAEELASGALQVRQRDSQASEDNAGRGADAGDGKKKSRRLSLKGSTLRREKLAAHKASKV